MDDPVCNLSAVAILVIYTKKWKHSSVFVCYISLHSKTHTPENVSFLLSIMILTFLITPLECGVTNPAGVLQLVTLSLYPDPSPMLDSRRHPTFLTNFFVNISLKKCIILQLYLLCGPNCNQS